MDSAEHLASLEFEREGYLRRNLPERVKAVDAEIKKVNRTIRSENAQASDPDVEKT